MSEEFNKLVLAKNRAPGCPYFIPYSNNKSMIKYTEIQLDQLAIHRVGNRNRAEKNFISENLFTLNEEMTEDFLKYFIKPMKRVEQYYRFQGEDGNYEGHPMHIAATTVFNDPTTLLAESENILRHLYAQSNHPKIKSGELFIAYFNGILIEDELVQGIGIFKSERKSSFFDVSESGTQLLVKKQQGINIEKLDKGCLILNYEGSDGYRIVTVDNNNYDANYWLYDFLDVDYVKDESFHTRSYIEMVNDFSEQVMGESTGRSEQLEFLNNSVDYFQKNDTFNTNDFLEAVIPAKDDFVEEFKSFQADYNFGDTEKFPISSQALKSASRKMNNTIKLDTRIQIKLDFNNPEGCRDFLEKGYDETRGMSYYKVYFNEES